MTQVEYFVFRNWEIVNNWIKRSFRNKYYISFGFFVLWMVFFDNDNFYRQIERIVQVNKIETEINYYNRQLIETKNEEKALSQNNNYFERFVREKYLLKKENEDVFIFCEESNP
jgi:hypothetical protein